MSAVSVVTTRSGWARAARRLAGPILSAVSLTAVVWWAAHQRAPRLPTGVASLRLLAFAVLVYACVTAARGVRWHAILRRAGVQVSMARAQALIVVGYMGNTVLPLRGGELLRVVLLGGRTESSRAAILGTIVAERLLDVATRLTMLLLLAFVTATGVNSASQLSPVAALLLLLLALALAGSWRLSRSGRLRHLSGRVTSLTLASRNLLSAHGLALLTAVVWLGEGYAGTYDAAIQLGLGALRVHGGRAVTFGLLVRLVIFVPITVAGLILVVLRYGGLASLGRVRRGSASAAADTQATLVGVTE